MSFDLAKELELCADHLKPFMFEKETTHEASSKPDTPNTDTLTFPSIITGAAGRLNNSLQGR